ncbi:hypothetical protein [Staphylococcus xylosus]|uniref:hypothetical protein n=1 Tax=Staphylococcus TaxID=1279 RepID=UPI00194F338D|nr:hypothetical protein [Staphylococcus xylosus]MBM6639605.1 hypothetical protein [Staphylococcus xylosus]
MNWDNIYLKFEEERKNAFHNLMDNLKETPNYVIEEIERIKTKEKKLMKNDEFVYSMFKYEMYNSDYIFGESDDLVLSNCNLPENILWENERLRKIYLKVRKEYLKIMEQKYF